MCEEIEPKQIIVMRKDLHMRKGKMIAQGAHAAMKVLLDALVDNNEDMSLLNKAMRKWLNGRFTKICVYVNSESELLELLRKAREANIPCALIEDSGLTEFHGVVTPTCIAIGPDYPDKLDPITKGLPLL